MKYLKELQLLDEILAIKEAHIGTQVLLNGKWYCAKGINFDDWRQYLYRIRNAWLVLRGRAHVYQFAEDRYPK